MRVQVVELPASAQEPAEQGGPEDKAPQPASGRQDGSCARAVELQAKVQWWLRKVSEGAIDSNVTVLIRHLQQCNCI